ncbi:poly(hydroxyalkanoate) granule-associated protein [Oxalobacteraceae bacterium GrIS 1.11]
MVKKLKTLAKDEEKQLASAVRTSAQQIWQAGLGAFAKAQEEGGRVFSKLVKEGTELQKRAEERVADVTGNVNKMAGGVQASGSWDKLEQVFEDRVARALEKIGMPTQKDIQALSKRIEQLSKTLAELSGTVSKPAAKPAAKAPAKAAPKVALKAAPAKAAALKKSVAGKADVNFPSAASIKKPAAKAGVKKAAVKAAKGGPDADATPAAPTA